MKKFYVTTPIYYVNAPPHMGTGYTTVIADALARFKRMQGFDAKLVTGSDEHSQGIADKAAAEGMTPEAFCSRLIPEFHDAWKLLDIGPYEFYRTSSPEHRVVVQAFFQKIYDKGDIYKKDYSGWYHTTDNRFLNEDEVPENPEGQANLKFLTEEAYWFRMSRYQDWLLQHHEAHPTAITPDFRRKEMLNRVKVELRDLCISRSSTDWGIPLPWDEKHVFYVWVDALLTYVTGSGYQFGAQTQPDNNFWPCNLHIMAKDIPWFHTVIWPTLLASAEMPQALQALVHGYWNFGDGTKMSKSKGNVFHPKDAVSLVGSDGVRYFLLREVRLGLDGTFSVRGLAERYNFDLANDFGNLCHRALSMAGRYLEGKVPTAIPEGSELEELRRQVADQVPAQYECLEFKEGLEKTWELVRACNRYIDDTKPFEVAKHPERRAELEGIFAQLFSSIRTLLLLLAPLLPRGCDDYWTQLGLPGKATEQQLTELHEPFPAGIVANTKPTIVYKKLDLTNLEEEFIVRKESMTGEKVERTDAAAEAPKPEAPKVEEHINYEDFTKVKMITAKVVKAEAIDGSDKLIRLTLDDGKRQDRTVVSGIKEHFSPEDMQGRTICIVDNLKPRKIFGIMSEGMILAAGDGTSLHLVTPQGELAPGTRVDSFPLMEYRWALQCRAEGHDSRELLDSHGQLEGHLRACQRYPAQLWLFRFHPDVWHKHDLQDTEPSRLWTSDLWSDCLSLHLASSEHTFINYFREAGDDGLLLYNPERDDQPVAVLLHDDEVAMAGWHTIASASAVPMLQTFLDTGFLPEAPAGMWWIDGDEQRVPLEEVWDEQTAAWEEERARWLAWLTPYNRRGQEYADQFAHGERDCPLCHAPGGVTCEEGGGELERCTFWCKLCQRRFEVSDVDRTPQEGVE